MIAASNSRHECNTPDGETQKCCSAVVAQAAWIETKPQGKEARSPQGPAPLPLFVSPSFVPYDSSALVLINSKSCDKSTNPDDVNWAEEFAAASLDDAIRADQAVLYPPCGAQVSLRGCGEGHLYGISAICGREWCDKCGGHRGRAHNRRVGQYLAMVQEWKSCAYAVLTIPPECRRAFHADRGLLSKAGASVRRWLRDHGVTRGVSRWHLFGEPGLGGEESPVSGPGFAPHLNILCEAAFVAPEWLAALRREWRLIVERLSGCIVDGRGHADRTDAVVIHWAYSVVADATGVRHVMHWLTYVMGPRFLAAHWDYALALRIVGWRNCVRWGRMTGVIAWELEDMAVEGVGEMKIKGVMRAEGRRVLAGECPDCGGRLHSLGMVPRDRLVVEEDYGGGVYRLRAVLGAHNKPKVERGKA